MEFDNTNRKIEKLNNKQTLIHKMNPFVKIVITVLYLALILSYSQYDLNGLIIFCSYPILAILIAEIPLRDVVKKVIMTLPFILVIGVSNLFMNRIPAIKVGELVITQGMLSLLTIMLKAGLSVTIIYVLIATTENTKLMIGFRMLHIPNLFLVQFELVIRYIGVLVEEARNMYYAYRLRAPGMKGIVFRHMGEFLGQLLVKSIYRAERIYHAMKCRGYHGNISKVEGERLQRKDYLQLLVISITMIICRFLKVV
jgi:cobalt/nickel transport system permease protein